MSRVQENASPGSRLSTPTRRRRAVSTPLALTFGALLLSLAAVVLGGFAAQPIYQTPHMWWLVVVSAFLSFLTVWAGRRWRWGALTVAALILLFAVSVVPLAVPSALGSGAASLVRGLGDGIAAVALGWKQLLTLTLPVGSYQTVLVPLLVVVMVSVIAITALTLLGGNWAPFAAVPALIPVVFGTAFGASSVSSPLELGRITISAPRELAVWICAFAVCAFWVAWSSGIGRRTALRLGRAATEGEPAAKQQGSRSLRRNAVGRGVVGAAVVAVALVAGTMLVPMLEDGSRTVPRDRIDPELVVREQASPLADYRSWKRDDTLEAPIFQVSSEGRLPGRLRIAVLDHYDGVDFTVGDEDGSGRFTRFPSGEPISDSVRVRVTIEAGYDDIWVPIAMPIADPPDFGGERSSELADSFYVNRDAGSAVAVPSADGLREGDSYEADMSVSGDAQLGAEPVSIDPLIDMETMPQLESWLQTQELPASAEGLSTAIELLRERGYLSHSLTDGEGEREWISALGEEYGTRFVTSAGGHSEARVEQLFEQLNDQQAAAGEGAKESMLVAGIGDDEQFATAAALVARAMGFESRVVLGVRLGSADDGVPGIPACSDTCTGQNVTAWVEVRGANGVWAPFDVTPQVETPPTSLEEGEQLPEYPTVPEERDASESDPPIGTSDSEGTDSDNDEGNPLSALWPVLRIIGLSLGTLALLALLLLFIPTIKRIRGRQRREAVSAEARAIGAWDELLDAYADSGVEVRGAASRLEAAETLGFEGSEWMAWTTDRAVYAFEGIDPEDADQLWQAVEAQIADRRDALGFWQRVRARYSLASFGVPDTRALKRGLVGLRTRYAGAAGTRGTTAKTSMNAEAGAR